MPLFILTETPAGYALLKAKDKKILSSGTIGSEIAAEEICSLLKLKKFQKFDTATTALEEMAGIIDGKVTPRLATLLDTIKDEKKASLAVADPKLANAINKLPQLSIAPISDNTTNDLYRAIKDHLPSLIPELLPEDMATMSLGLSHSLSRHKLKFSPDKIDTMIVQAIALLDDLDKELNMYAMRVKEWYGWHFPELSKILNDNMAYARVILKMGMRTNAKRADLAEILPEQIEDAVKAAAEISMGTEVTADDLDTIKALAEVVVDFSEYRQQLSSYLSARMAAIAPNLTALVGELVGARLMAHAGSLMNLAKSPASTIQILGAEKALFRALKTKHDTPKYGLIYHASLIGQASGKNKGKIARILAAKAAIGIRTDALMEWDTEDGKEPSEEQKSALGREARIKIERRLAGLEGKPLRPKGVAIGPNGVQAQPSKWEIKEARKYNPNADGLVGDEPAANQDTVSEPVTKHSEVIPKAIPSAMDIDGGEVDEDSEMASGPEEVEKATEKAKAELGIAGPVTTDLIAETLKIDTSKSNGAGPSKDDDRSATISTISADSPDSPDSPTQQERNWQSEIKGNTKVAKKARKKERHERKLALSGTRSKERADRNAKIERRLDRKKRRLLREAQIERREGRSKDQDEVHAKEAGLSLVRYKRKLERGEIAFAGDGKAVAISKKDIKKARKAADKGDATTAVAAAAAAAAGAAAAVEEMGKKKRKRDKDEDKATSKEEKKAKKKKKTSTV